MEEILPRLKSMLKEVTVISSDVNNFEIVITVVKKINGIVAEPDEIIIMLKMYGGLREDIPMEINIDNNAQNITLKFQNEEDFKKVAKIMDTLWDNAVDMLTSAMEGDISRIKDIPNLDD